MSASKPLDWTSNLTPYADAAAGHQGLSSNASGSLIIKPCTQAEIDFYESSKQHPEFQAHMPTYMGNLILNQDGAVQALSNVLKEQGDGTTPIPSTRVTSNTSDTAKGDKADPEPWIPSGGKQISTGLAIVLENATTGFKRPNVLDLKLGSRLWDDNAPEAKRQKLDQVAEETTSGSLGFRVAGMKLWIAGSTENKDMKEINTEVKEGYKNFNKMYGRSLHENNVKDAFIRFLGGQKTNAETESGSNNKQKIALQRPKAKILLQRLLREIESIQYVLEHEESRMYSASILVVAEGDDDALETALDEEPRFLQKQHEQDQEDAIDDVGNDVEDNEDDEEEEEIGPRILEVRLIDFAHAGWVPGQGPDENALKGVRNIRKIVEELLLDSA